MKNAIAYLRVSTENQVGEDKYGLDAQRNDITAYAAKNDITIIDWFVDEGVSGGKLDRPELNKIMSGELPEGVTSVVVAKTDRLSRDIQLYYFIKLTLTKKNLEVLSVQEDWESYGIMAPMLEAMVIAFAEFERQMITSRTTNGRNIKASKGGYSGGKPPYGYLVTDGKLVIEPEEAEIVRGIFQLHEEGNVLRVIVEQLDGFGITTRKGGKFYPSTVGYIVRNKPFYQGLYQYGDMEAFVPGHHQAII